MTPLGGLWAWLRREQGWVCRFGYNHYLFGCPAHQCRNRDGVIRFQFLPRRPTCPKI